MSVSFSQTQVSVVTGGARGIGEATARLLLARGHRVVIADIDGDRAEQTALSMGAGVSGHRLDVSDRAEFEAFLDMVEMEIGPVGLLVNNAGIAAAAPSTIAQDPLIVDRTLAINLNGVIYGTLAALRYMEGRGSGHVVNVASLAGIAGVRGLPVYAASKFGVVGFTESLRAEYSGSGINFTCVMPGPVATDMMIGTRKTPLVRLISPQAVALGIIGAVDSRKERVSLPKSTGFFVRVLSLLPPPVAIRLNRLIGLDRVYAEIDEAARAEYNERISAAARSA